MAPRRSAQPRRKPDSSLTAADAEETGSAAPASRSRGERRTTGGAERQRARRRSEESPLEVAPARGGGGGGGGAGSGGRRRGLARLLYWSVVLGLWAFIAAIATIAWVGAHLPPIQSLEVPKRPPAIEIVDLSGRLLATRGDTSGPPLPLKELPAYLPQAFIAIEDRRFYSHHGVDPLGIIRAVAMNLARRGVSQGGSTLTQQLAKNLFLTQERTVTRKLQELLLAFWLERKFSKQQILELYLNRVYFGAGAYGVEAAAQRYFGKSARQVTIAEAALLAGLVKSPSRLAPTRNPDGAERRAQIVLVAMSQAGFITERMAQLAISNSPRILKQTPGGSGNYVADWIMDVLNDLVGRLDEDIVVETTIDARLQGAADKALVEELAQKGEKFAVGQGAILAMTPDGAVRALVGGRNYAESQFNRAVAAKRQPGSAFKPFVYLTALEHGLTPETVREDRPLDVKGWRPENYNREYFGPVTLTRALAQSLNTVAVRLTLELGPQAVVRTAHRLGIASKLDPNPSIALGTSEVSLIEMVSAFAPFANGGIAVIPHVVERVRTREGRMLYENADASLGRVVEERYVGMMNAMMAETLRSGTARRAQLPGWPAAGKTGTSQDFRDAWFIGYSGYLVAGVWLGNDDNSPTHHTTGGSLPVEIWSRFMRAAHQGAPLVELPGVSGSGWGVEAPPVPPGPLPWGSQAAVRQQGRAPASLDGWLLDRLFGR
jgi:penicillin-binding protein 1A